MFELTEQLKIERALRTKLCDIGESSRRDAALFAALTVLLTPFAMALFVITLLCALAFVDLPVIDHSGYSHSFLTGANLCVAFMAASYFLRPKAQYQQKKSDDNWLLVAFALSLAHPDVQKS